MLLYYISRRNWWFHQQDSLGQSTLNVGWHTRLCIFCYYYSLYFGQTQKIPCAICFYFDRYMCNSLVSLHFFLEEEMLSLFLCMATSNPLFAILELHQASLPLFSRNASFFKRIFRARGPGKNDYQAFCFSQVWFLLCKNTEWLRLN